MSPSMPPSSNIINSPLAKHQRQHSWTTFLMHSSNRINPNFLSNSFKRDKLQSGSKSGELRASTSTQSQFTPPKVKVLPHHKRGHSLSSLSSKKIQFQNGVKSGELSTVQEKAVKPSKWQSLSRFLGIRTTTIPKRTVPKCDSKNREKMKEFKYY